VGHKERKHTSAPGSHVAVGRLQHFDVCVDACVGLEGDAGGIHRPSFGARLPARLTPAAAGREAHLLSGTSRRFGQTQTGQENAFERLPRSLTHAARPHRGAQCAACR
jgi:hypothetical protein